MNTRRELQTCRPSTEPGGEVVVSELRGKQNKIMSLLKKYDLFLTKNFHEGYLCNWGEASLAFFPLLDRTTRKTSTGTVHT